MFKSLRWRLQVWHALVLLVVLTSFGAVVYDLQWKSALQQVDARLNQLANTTFQRGARRPRGRDENRQEPEQAPRSEPANALQPEVASNESRPSPLPNDFGRQFRDRPPRFMPKLLIERFEALTHSDDDAQVGSEDDSPCYLVVWDEHGEAHASAAAPSIANPQLNVEKDDTINRMIREQRRDHLYRELVLARRYPDSTVRNYVLGQSLEAELARHHQRGFMLIATGLVILAAGTLGGGWLSARAIRPINDMTLAAESISVQNLSQRIDVHETDSELGKLADVLNHTFDRLQSAFERQQQFTADASHELRTPVAVIATHTELALSRPRSNDEYRAAIETCQRAAKRMRSLIDAMLTLARFDSGIPQLKMDRVELEPLIQDCVDLVRPLASDRGIQIQNHSVATETLGDWDRLSQVVTNLLANAIRYNHDAGRIEISTRAENQKAVISVVDSGIGIPEDQLPQIFDRFFQVDKARSRAEGSCGLGLSICKLIVEAHGGEISVSSRSGSGTTVEVRLPLSGFAEGSDSSAQIEENLIVSASPS